MNMNSESIKRRRQISRPSFEPGEVASLKGLKTLNTLINEICTGACIVHGLEIDTYHPSAPDAITGQQWLSMHNKSNDKIIIWCADCFHIFDIAITKLPERWCRFCSNSSLCLSLDCRECTKRSCASDSDLVIKWRGIVEPRFVSKGSSTTIYLYCDICNHVYDLIASNARKSGCPYCAIPTKRVCGDSKCINCFDKSLASIKNIAERWSYTQNADKPINVTYSSGKKRWFNCFKCNHASELAIYSLHNNEDMCSYCGGGRLCEDVTCTTCAKRSCAADPFLLMHWSFKNELPPYAIGRTSKTLIHISCCHEFSRIARDFRGCPFCSSPPKELCNDESCVLCFQKSCASIPHIATRWSLTNETSPRFVFSRSSTQNVVLDCKCGSTWKGKPASMWSDDNKSRDDCPHCHEQKSILCDDSECQLCFNRSCASDNRIVQHWSSLNKCTPRDVCRRSGKLIFIDCQCGHTFEQQPQNNTWCPYCCSPPIKLCTEKTCTKCFAKSCASDENIMNLWDFEKNEKIPRDVFLHSNYQINWKCNICGGIWTAPPSRVTNDHSGQGSRCPHCVLSYAEKCVKTWFDNENITYVSQYKQEWCKDTRLLPFDFYIPLLAIVAFIFEIDGIQHFFWKFRIHDFEKAQKHDLNKMQNAIKNNKSIVRMRAKSTRVSNWYETFLRLISHLSPNKSLIIVEDCDEYRNWNILKDKSLRDYVLYV